MSDPNKVNPSAISPGNVAEPTSESKVKTERPASEARIERQQEPPVKPDGYKVANQVARILVAANIPAAAALVLRVADRIVQDHRPEHSEQGEGAREHDHDSRRAEGHGPHAKRTGGAGGTPETAEGVKKAHGAMSAAETEVAIKAAKFGNKDRPLTSFEKTLVSRFEEGLKQAKESADGQFHFLKKSAGEWTGFFEKFVSRTMQKVMNWDDVQGLLFRGLLQEKGSSQKGVMISDVMTAMGTDKFARISVALSKAQQLAMATPGAMLTKEALQGAVLGDQLRYLAINPQLGEEGAARFTQAASRGMFASQQLENRVAEHLGIITDFRGAGVPGAARDAEAKRAADARRRRGGVWSSLFGGDDVGGEGSMFVPWWSWNREERTGFRRWFVVVFGSVIFIALFFLVIFILHSLRS